MVTLIDAEKEAFDIIQHLFIRKKSFQEYKGTSSTDKDNPQKSIDNIILNN